MNTITIAGNIGRAGLKTLKDGNALLSFTVADNYRKDQDPIWWDCSLIGQRAEALAQHLVKGQSVVVTGRLVPNNYVSRMGDSIRGFNLQATDIALLGGKPQATQPAEQPQPVSEPVPTAPEAEIPF